MERVCKMNSKRGLYLLGLIFAIVLVASGVLAAEITGTYDDNVCCEKTKSGLYCQNVNQNDCDTTGSLRAIKTSCDATAFCKGGYCYDDTEGTCLDNVPQLVCNAKNATWSEGKPAACELGCCLLGDQASFVTLVRCKRLSSFLGLETNFNSEITDSTQCLLAARAEERGACVFERDYQRTCVFTTRSECTDDIIGNSGAEASGQPATQFIRAQATTGSGTTAGGQSGSSTSGGSGTSSGGTGNNNGGSGTTVTGNAVNEGNDQSGNVSFYAGRLCTDPALDTICGKTTDTICVPGKEEVYFKDTCGNPANIYDASKTTSAEYWSKIIDKSKSCKPESANTLSADCGNCNYLLGSYCREVTPDSKKPKYGSNICADLNCVDSKGQNRIHGESWCGYDVQKSFETNPKSGGAADILRGIIQSANSGNAGGQAPVGSKFYRYVCVNGDITIEPCADYRQEECLENTIQTSIGPFKQAACRVNRWQDCTAQKNSRDCLNTDKRDCRWMEGLEYALMTGGANGSTSSGAVDFASVKQAMAEEIKQNGIPKGACVPKIPPGLQFWGDSSSGTASNGAGTEARGICAQANAVCDVHLTKGLIGGDWECDASDPKNHCECLSKELEQKRAQVCSAMGDCGMNVNYVGQMGNSQGYAVKINKLVKED